VLPLVLALVFLALAIACLTVLYLLLRYRRRRENDEERRSRFAYSPRYLPAFCFKLRYVVELLFVLRVCLTHRLNMELDLQILFGLLCTAVLIG
jgi:hypothetical protein